MSSATSYTLLEAQLPISGLVQASNIPEDVFQTLSSSMTGKALSDAILHFSLGLFLIDVTLVEQHPSQREISSSYVNDLVKDFEETQISRMENAGVVIGLGNGWEGLKNVGGDIYRITPSSPCLDMLRVSSGGPIAQVIRGGHRTEAIRRFSEKPGMSNENYWCYTVLLPSTNRLPAPLLMDYSCMDNLVLRVLPNSANRDLFNYAQVVESLYASIHPRTSDRIFQFLKRHNENTTVKINGLRHLLKYKEVVPHVVRLLQGGGGVWSGDCEVAFSTLVKCRVEKAIVHVIEACADQTRLISGSLSLSEGVSYSVDNLLRGGEGALGLPANNKSLSAGTRISMTGLMTEESPIYQTINEMVWKTGSGTFGPVFLNPNMVGSSSSPVGKFLANMKRIYCVIILMFLGPARLSAALPRGGQSSAKYPINDDYHLEGHLKKHWEGNKVNDVEMKTFQDVSLFIFRRVLHCHQILEDKRALSISEVPESWKGRINETQSQLPKLKTLIHCQEWKKLVEDIRDRVMPLWHEYEQLFAKVTASHQGEPLGYQSSSSFLGNRPPIPSSSTNEFTVGMKRELIELNLYDNDFPSSNPNLGADGFELFEPQPNPWRTASNPPPWTPTRASPIHQSPNPPVNPAMKPPGWTSPRASPTPSSPKSTVNPAKILPPYGVSQEKDDDDSSLTSLSSTSEEEEEKEEDAMDVDEDRSQPMDVDLDERLMFEIRKPRSEDDEERPIAADEEVETDNEELPFPNQLTAAINKPDEPAQSPAAAQPAQPPAAAQPTRRPSAAIKSKPKKATRPKAKPAARPPTASTKPSQAAQPPTATTKPSQAAPPPAAVDYTVLNRNASMIIKEGQTPDGLTSEEATRWLGALLALSEDERRQALGLSQKTLTGGFRSFLPSLPPKEKGKGKGKEKEVGSMKSPDRKRAKYEKATPGSPSPRDQGTSTQADKILVPNSSEEGSPSSEGGSPSSEESESSDCESEFEG